MGVIATNSHSQSTTASGQASRTVACLCSHGFAWKRGKKHKTKTQKKNNNNRDNGKHQLTELWNRQTSKSKSWDGLAWPGPPNSQPNSLCLFFFSPVFLKSSRRATTRSRNKNKMRQSQGSRRAAGCFVDERWPCSAACNPPSTFSTSLVSTDLRTSPVYPILSTKCPIFSGFAAVVSVD